MIALIRGTEIWLNPQISESELIWQSTKFPNGNSYAIATDAPEDSAASDFDISEVTEEGKTGEVGEDGNELIEEIIRMVAILNRTRYEARKEAETELISKDNDGYA